MVPGPTLEKATKGVPDRWLNCPKTGSLIMDVFFPFKTPLCDFYDDQILDKKLRFHVNDVFSHVNLEKRKIGLWLDLTKTDRYYFREDVTKHSCVYKKIPLCGHNASPTEEEAENFIKTVSEFRLNHPNEVVGVHCTHGFNRTGFLIASYLFSVEGWGIDAAISEFARNRNGGIYKQEYINDLFDRYGEEDDDRIEAPPKPTWDEQISGCFESINQHMASTSTNHQSSEDIGIKKRKQFMDGLVGGVEICTDQGTCNILKAKIKSLCGCKKDGFPGLQPVSLSRQNIVLLEQEVYKVSWKADGMRYMVYIRSENEIYGFDRDNEVFQIHNLTFPARKGGHVQNTLVDAEMIIDKVNINGTINNIPRLLIYDIIHFQNYNLMKEDYETRRTCIRNEIIGPRKYAIAKNKISRNAETISVRIKEFWDISAVSKLFEPKFLANVGHEIDGLIFQPVDKPYVPGRCDYVLKWKPPSHNSVDFLLKIEKIKKEGMLPEWNGNLYVLHESKPFGIMKATNSLKQYDGKIIECTLEIDDHGRPKEWKFMRERTDKSTPNALRTAQNVLETMKNPVTKEWLCEFIAQRCHYGHQTEGESTPKRQKLCSL